MALSVPAGLVRPEISLMVVSFVGSFCDGADGAAAGNGGETGEVVAGAGAVGVGMAGPVIGAVARGAGSEVVELVGGGVIRAASAGAATFFASTGDITPTDEEGEEDNREITLPAPPAAPSASVDVGGFGFESLPIAGKPVFEPAVDLTRTGDGTLVATGETVLFRAGALFAVAPVATESTLLAGLSLAVLAGAVLFFMFLRGERDRLSLFTVGDLILGACGTCAAGLLEAVSGNVEVAVVAKVAVVAGESSSVFGNKSVAAVSVGTPVAGLLLLSLMLFESVFDSTLMLAPFISDSSRSMSIAAAGAW